MILWGIPPFVTEKYYQEKSDDFYTDYNEQLPSQNFFFLAFWIYDAAPVNLSVYIYHPKIKVIFLHISEDILCLVKTFARGKNFYWIT